MTFVDVLAVCANLCMNFYTDDKNKMFQSGQPPISQHSEHCLVVKVKVNVDLYSASLSRKSYFKYSD